MGTQHGFLGGIHLAGIEEESRDRYADVWKYLTAIGFSLLFGLIGGQFIPNRNIVTTDQLNSATSRLESGQATQAAEISALTTQVAVLSTELKLKGAR
jgi:hypothetical protein